MEPSVGGIAELIRGNPDWHSLLKIRGKRPIKKEVEQAIMYHGIALTPSIPSYNVRIISGEGSSIVKLNVRDGEKVVVYEDGTVE